MFRFQSNDAHLVAQVLSGRKEHFAALVERYLPAVRAVARANAGSHADADDIAQDTFVDAYRTLDKLRERNKFAHWLLRIARNKARDWAEADRRERLKRAAAGAGAGFAEVPPTPEEREIHALLHAELEAMPPEQREVLALFHFAGHSTRQIAGMLEISHDAVRKRLQRGREALGERMLRRMEEPQNPEERGKRARAISGAAIAAAAAWDAKASAGRWTSATGWGMGVKAGAIGVVCVVTAVSGVFVRRADERASVADGVELTTTVVANSDPAGEFVVVAMPANSAPVTTGNVVSASEMPRGEGELRGYVSGRTGLPVAGISVTLSRERSAGALPEAVAEGVTDTRGKLVLEELPWGRYFLRASKGGLVARAAVTLDVDRPVAQAELVLKPGGDITGRVANAEAAPVVGAAIQLMDEEGEDEAPARAVTDEDGAFVLEDVPLGRYRVRAVAEGFAPVLTGEVGVESAPLAIAMERGGALEAIVRVAVSQLPAPDVALMLGSPQFAGLERTISTDKQGRFEADTLPTGPCYIVCADDRYAFNPARAEFAIADGRVERAELFLQDGAQVSGTITDGETGEPLAGVVVTASDLPSKMHWWKSSPSGADGRYTISGLSAGICEIYGYNPPPKYGSGGSKLRVTHELEPGESRDGVDFRYYRGVLIEGVVVDDAGTPVPRARVALDIFRPGEEVTKGSSDAFTDASGAFAFPNVRLLRLWDDEGDDESDQHLGGVKFTLRAAYRNLRYEDAEPLDLPPDGISGITLRLKSVFLGAVSGFVVDAAGKPARVRMLFERIDIPPLGSHGVSSDVDGFYLANHLEAGTYGLRIAPRDDYARTFELAEGQRISDLRIVLAEGFRISGRVVDAGGRPAKRANVWISRIVLDENGEWSFAPAFGTFTNDDGYFEALNLEEGEYEVATSSGGASWRGILTAGDDVEIVLTPAAQGTDTDP